MIVDEAAIIKVVLRARPPMTDCSLLDELERQSRMFVILRHSKSYRKARITCANECWDECYPNEILESEATRFHISFEDIINSSSIPSTKHNRFLF